MRKILSFITAVMIFMSAVVCGVSAATLFPSKKVRFSGENLTFFYSCFSKYAFISRSFISSLPFLHSNEAPLIRSL